MDSHLSLTYTNTRTHAVERDSVRSYAFNSTSFSFIAFILFSGECTLFNTLLCVKMSFIYSYLASNCVWLAPHLYTILYVGGQMGDTVCVYCTMSMPCNNRKINYENVCESQNAFIYIYISVAEIQSFYIVNRFRYHHTYLLYIVYSIQPQK